MKISKSLFILLLVSVVFQSCISVKPAGTITNEKANEFEERYKRTRANIINESLNYTDTREVWFDLDRVKQYIAYVESEAKKKDYKNLGLRVYFGVYPADENGEAFTTIFFVPTTNPNEQPDATNQQRRTIMFSTQANNNASENDNITDIDALNYGGLGHPPKEYEPED